MGISFLAPIFLLGAAALAVPIIIHLVHRQKPEGTAFPSLMFLRQIPYKAQRRQKIRHWFLFLTRCLAVILIAMAFARPLFQGADVAAALTTGGRDLVVVVDRSFSMGYGGRWGQAVEAARRVIDGIGPEDRASLVMFDHQATAVTQPTSDRAALLATLGRQELGSGMTDYSVALRLAQQILADSDLPHREIVVISDFQRTGQDGQDEVRLAEGIRLTPVDLSAPDASNVAVASVSLSQRPRAGREEVLVSARVVQWGGTREVSTTVRLELNGQELVSQSLQLAPGQSETVVFEPVLVPVGTSRGIVRVDDPKLESDNVFHFVLTPGRALPVLVLESTSARENQSLFLARALGVGDRPAFAVDVKPISAFRLTDLEDRSLVVMNDTPFPEGNAGQQILNYVKGGGGLFVVLGERADRGWTATLANAAGATLGHRVERTTGRGATVTQLEYSHPVFDVFNAPRSGDFSSARIYRYRELVLQDQLGVLARYDDGGPAIVERKIGEGRLLVMTTTLDTYWNDLALQPVFLPFMHQMAKYLTRYREASPWFTVGDVVGLAAYLERVDGSGEVLGAMTDNREILVEAPSGRRERLTGGDALVEVAEGGFYDVQPAGVHSDPAVPLAVNVSAVESDLSVLDVEEFMSAVSTGSADGFGSEMAGPASPADYEKRQRLWWYLLAAALAVLGVETVVSNRLSRAVR